MKQNKYIYINEATKDEFLSFADIAAEYGTTRGTVAGKFRRAKDNRIVIKGVRIRRIRYIPDVCIKERRKSFTIMPEPGWNLHALEQED